MAIVEAVSVTSESQATVLEPPAGGGYRLVAICNNGSQTAYLKFFPDGGDVTPATGIALPAGASILVDQDDSPILQNGVFAVCASGQSTSLAVQAY